MKMPVLALIMAALLTTGIASAQDRPSCSARRTAATDPAGQRSTTPEAAIDKQLIASECALQEAVAKGDKSTFGSLVLLTGGFWLSSTSDGFIPMNLLVDSLENFHLTKWDILNPRVTWLDADSAIVSGGWTASGTFGDRPVSAVVVATTTWTKRDGKWVAVAHQETELRR